MKRCSVYGCIMDELDEAIEKYKEITNTDANCPAHCNISCDKRVQESKQLAEWLEELKDYRDENKMVVRVDVENMDSIKDKFEVLSKYAEIQYNKAIDDFAKLVEIWCWKHEQYNQDDLNKLMNIAERLKAGGENEQSI